ncbi:hypothetical protein DES49_1691 [Halospina denitrificans]|uniref:Pilus assembly protein PilB n=1 Tax=Halospina denitrificans TaxID=332522 RepID=A0A4R7JTF2_9GAMM|nr:pilus assembly protein PilB [Halospina denitrificans]TDT41592.1 hypothetical protein DES49_1691 [Halospina denitrificans]
MVTPNKQQLEKSRLGRLLVNRGYITDEQLTQALGEQRESGMRLGEVLTRAGWITQRELDRTLKHQNRYRYRVAVTAMVVAPLQPVAALASPVPALPTVAVPAAGQQQSLSTGMRALSEAEMGQVSGQGSDDLATLADAIQGAPDSDQGAEDQALDALEITAKTFIPVLNFLDTDVTVSGVEFGDQGPGYRIMDNGALSLNMPQRIEEIRMDHIRVEGSPASASMGSIRVSNLRFSADSQLTIRAHR